VGASGWNPGLGRTCCFRFCPFLTFDLSLFLHHFSACLVLRFGLSLCFMDFDAAAFCILIELRAGTFLALTQFTIFRFCPFLQIFIRRIFRIFLFLLFSRFACRRRTGTRSPLPNCRLLCVVSDRMVRLCFVIVS